MPEFYMIFARKINKMPEFYMIFARKIYFCPNWEGASAPCPPSPTPMHSCWHSPQIYRLRFSIRFLINE